MTRPTALQRVERIYAPATDARTLRLDTLDELLPVEILGRMRSDRVLRRPVGPQMPGTNGRPPKHGTEFVFADPATWGAEQAVTSTDTRLYGTATAQA